MKTFVEVVAESGGATFALVDKVGSSNFLGLLLRSTASSVEDEAPLFLPLVSEDAGSTDVEVA